MGLRMLTNRTLQCDQFFLCAKQEALYNIRLDAPPMRCNKSASLSENRNTPKHLIKHSQNYLSLTAKHMGVDSKDVNLRSLKSIEIDTTRQMQAQKVEIWQAEKS